MDKNKVEAANNITEVLSLAAFLRECFSQNREEATLSEDSIFGLCLILDMMGDRLTNSYDLLTVEKTSDLNHKNREELKN